jgi:hypothetical protein
MLLFLNFSTVYQAKQPASRSTSAKPPMFLYTCIPVHYMTINPDIPLSVHQRHPGLKRAGWPKGRSPGGRKAGTGQDAPARPMAGAEIPDPAEQQTIDPRGAA